MSSQRGFITLEALFYVIISIILTTLLSIIILRASHINNNHDIKVYQSIDKLRNSIKKYQSYSAFNPDMIEFNYQNRIVIKDNQIYETPGYLPYFQSIYDASFILEDDLITLNFTYYDKEYNYVIFYQK